MMKACNLEQCHSTPSTAHLGFRQDLVTELWPVLQLSQSLTHSSQPSCLADCNSMAAMQRTYGCARHASRCGADVHPRSSASTGGDVPIASQSIAYVYVGGQECTDSAARADDGEINAICPATKPCKASHLASGALACPWAAVWL